MDTKTQAKLLSIVCFCVLMENGTEGIQAKHYDYILEKYERINNPYWMFNSLHLSLKPLVYTWGERWGVDFKALVEQMAIDYDRLPHGEYKEKYGGT